MGHFIDDSKGRDSKYFLACATHKEVMTLLGLPPKCVDEDVGIEKNVAPLG